MSVSRLWGKRFPKRHRLADVGGLPTKEHTRLGPGLVLARPRPRRTNLMAPPVAPGTHPFPLPQHARERCNRGY